MNWLNGLPLLGGQIPQKALAVAVVCMLLLLALCGWRLLWRRLLLMAAGSVLTAVVAWLIVEKLWHPIAEPLGRQVWISLGCMVLVAGLAFTPGAKDRQPRRQWTWPVSALLVVTTWLSIGTLVNVYFSAFSTVGDLIGTSVVTTDLDLSRATSPVTTELGIPLEAVWKPPMDMPTHGTLSLHQIPGTRSGFNARSALIYLPPAYLTVNRPLLPVLVLLPGQPGKPIDWQTGGNLQQTMDAYAAQHAGLAPIVVVPDALGMSISNPLCSDTSHGNVATYLERDVPDWITHNLQVDTRRKHWGVAGASNGATCTMQIVTRQPDAFPNFVAMSSESEPSLGDRNRTIKLGFDGNSAAFTANNPRDLLSSRSYPQVTGLFMVGDGDTRYLPASSDLHRAAADAGMSTEMILLHGGHSWTVWKAALQEAAPWLGQQMGLTK